MKPVIEVTDISKSYQISHQAKASYNTIKDDFEKLLRRPFGGTDGDKIETFWALKDINFQVNQGEVFGIVGKNGSGKSTLLKILSRIVDPTTGIIKIHGKVASLLEVGTGFHPELTGRENIYFNGSMIGMSKQEITRKFDEIVAFSGVEKFLDTPVKFYSSGMYVRLAFSVAAHLESEILIIDEVLSVGDAQFQKKSLAKMTSIANEGRTVLFVSHSMGAVQQLCTKGILLNNGQLEFMGSTDELTAKYIEISSGGETPDDTVTARWTAESKGPANDYFDLNSMYLTNNAGEQLKKSTKGSDEVWVNFVMDVKNPAEDLMVGYAVHSKTHNLLYFSYFADKPSSNHIKLSKGRSLLKGNIPANLLNEGDYRISIVASIHNKFWIYEPAATNSPSVELKIRGGLSHEEYWAGAREGILAPEIVWMFDSMPNNKDVNKRMAGRA